MQPRGSASPGVVGLRLSTPTGRDRDESAAKSHSAYLPWPYMVQTQQDLRTLMQRFIDDVINAQDLDQALVAPVWPVPGA